MSSSTARVHKFRTLAKKRKIAEEHNIKIYEDVIVIEYPDGFLQVQQWDGEKWVILLMK